jgi:hypothetical protein
MTNTQRIDTNLGQKENSDGWSRFAAQSCYARGPARTPVRAFATVLLTFGPRNVHG